MGAARADSRGGPRTRHDCRAARRASLHLASDRMQTAAMHAVHLLLAAWMRRHPLARWQARASSLRLAAPGQKKQVRKGIRDFSVELLEGARSLMNSSKRAAAFALILLYLQLSLHRGNDSEWEIALPAGTQEPHLHISHVCVSRFPPSPPAYWSTDRGSTKYCQLRSQLSSWNMHCHAATRYMNISSVRRGAASHSMILDLASGQHCAGLSLPPPGRAHDDGPSNSFRLLRSRWIWLSLSGRTESRPKATGRRRAP